MICLDALHFLLGRVFRDFGLFERHRTATTRDALNDCQCEDYEMTPSKHIEGHLDAMSALEILGPGRKHAVGAAEESNVEERMSTCDSIARERV